MHSAPFSFGYKVMLAAGNYQTVSGTNELRKLKNNVIPRAVSEHKLSSLCEQARGTLSLI